jgi:outer membrane protein assembly factor BamB
LICLDKRSGKLLGEERCGISARTLKCNWSSPGYGVVNGQPMVIFAGDDGFCYAFDPEPVASVDGGLGVLREIWRFDCNPAEYRAAPDGTPVRFGDPKGPNGILATPVFHDAKVYVATGQDPENADGVGALVCIDAAAGTGDITRSGLVWIDKQIGRSISTVAVAGGLVYAAELAGKVYCFDAKTGQLHWIHDAEGNIWGSPLVADGKVYIGTEGSTLWAFAAGREKKVLSDSTLNGSILSTPVAANGVLYVLTSRSLYGAQQK